jgi:hypothetical protein
MEYGLTDEAVHHLRVESMKVDHYWLSETWQGSRLGWMLGEVYRAWVRRYQKTTVRYLRHEWVGCRILSSIRVLRERRCFWPETTLRKSFPKVLCRACWARD